MANAHTERDMLNALRVRYNQTNPGNGPRYAIAEHVKNAAGFDARRQADMIVMDLWPGHRGQNLALIGHEVKCSRSDWLTELKDPGKAETFKRYMHHWYLVVSDAAIVRPEELPVDWGLIVRLDSGMLRAKKKAPRLIPEPLPYMMLAPLLRAANIAGRYDGRQEAIAYVAPRPCSRCGSDIQLRADGKWEHVESAKTRCTFPEGHYLKPYEGVSGYRFEGRP